jgi:hypothetical protein
VLQAGRDPRLPHGTFARLLGHPLGQRVPDDESLDGDGTAEPFVLRLPDDAHGAAADLLDQPIPAGDQCTLLDDQGLLVWFCVPGPDLDPEDIEPT